nr:methyltransferase [Pseudomonas brassicacearum subsp. brassicacearum]
MPAKGADSGVLTGEALLARFTALDTFLTAHQALWKPRPFTHLQLPWETSHPELSQWLRQRSLEAAENDHHQPWLMEHAPAPFPELAAISRALSAVAELPASTLEAPSHRLNVDVPGRKWQQIEAFASRLHFTTQPTHWLDWCAGKGHLGRRLLHGEQQLTCLEYDPALVASGQQLSLRHRLPATHLQQDVLAADATQALHPGHTPVALHACGDLHVRLMQLASAAGCAQLAIAPCCYNRINTERYQALSDAAKGSVLQLSLDDLSLPLTETVTAGARVRRQRDQSMARRLGFDLLQRHIRECDDYLPTPHCPAPGWKKILRPILHRSGGPERLIHSRHAGLARLGSSRPSAPGRSAQPGVVARPFPAATGALAGTGSGAVPQSKKGYEVRLGTFCETPLTPRNLMLLAERC